MLFSSSYTITHQTAITILVHSAVPITQQNSLQILFGDALQLPSPSGPQILDWLTLFQSQSHNQTANTTLLDAITQQATKSAKI